MLSDVYKFISAGWEHDLLGGGSNSLKNHVTFIECFTMLKRSVSLSPSSLDNSQQYMQLFHTGNLCDNYNKTASINILI